jgi:hypothetical protein
MRTLGRATPGQAAFRRWTDSGQGGCFDYDTLQVVDESWGDEPETLLGFLVAEADHSSRPGTMELAERGAMSRVNLRAFPAEILAALRWIERAVEVPAKSQEGHIYFRCPSRSEVWRAAIRCGLRNLALPEVFSVDAMLKRGLFALAVSGFRFEFSKRGILDHAETRAQPYLPLGLVAAVEEFATKSGLETATSVIALVLSGLSTDRGGLACWSEAGPPWPFPSRFRRAVEDFQAALAEHHAELAGIARAPGAQAVEAWSQ